MNSKKVAETIQQEREWAKAEYESKTKGLNFTKDFYTRQEAVMRDPLATVGERVMAWILRRSWGEYRLYAIKEDGEPAYQRDCAKQLGIDKRLVSNAVAYYQKRGYLENQPKKLYPAISPVLGGPPEKVTRSPDFLQFIKQWKVTHSQDFLDLEVARSTVKRIRKVILSEYKKSKAPPKDAAASLLEIKRDKTESPSSSAVSSLPAPRKAEEEDDRSSYQKLKAAYPAARFDEPKTKPSFERKTKAEQTHILERLQIYLRCERWQDDAGRWIPLASTWLRSYDADPPPVLKKAPPKQSTKDAVIEEAKRRYAKYGRI